MIPLKASLNALLSTTSEMKVLYVEDNPLIQKSTVEILSLLFASVDTATNGQEGLDAYHTSTYDLIFTDLSMPVMDGIEMIRTIKEKNPDQKIIVISANFDVRTLRDLANLDVHDFVPKPYPFELLFDTIQKVVSPHNPPT